MQRSLACGHRYRTSSYWQTFKNLLNCATPVYTIGRTCVFTRRKLYCWPKRPFLPHVAAGKVKGNFDLQEALAYAERAGQDLVQLGYNPRDDIARCVIISYSTFLNRHRDKKKKAPKQPKVKTARFREDITSNDILTKAKQTKKWIAKGLQVGPCAGKDVWTHTRKPECFYSQKSYVYALYYTKPKR